MTFEEIVTMDDDCAIEPTPIREALVNVFNALPAHMQAERLALRDILAQRGCEHLDSGCKNGYLTTLMEIVIYG